MNLDPSSTEIDYLETDMWHEHFFGHGFGILLLIGIVWVIARGRPGTTISESPNDYKRGYRDAMNDFADRK
jgi:hypothetical protein